MAQKWRRFWLTNIFSVSFVLALAGVVLVGDASAVNANTELIPILKYAPKWFAFAVKPAAMKFSSLSASRLRRRCATDTRNAGGEKAGDTRAWKALRNGGSAAASAVRLEPGFYAVLCAWFAVSLAAWLSLGVLGDFSQAIAVMSFSSSSNRESIDDSSDLHGPEVTANIIELVAANLALAAGLAMMAVRLIKDRARSPMTILGPRHPTSRRFTDDHDGTGLTRRQQPTRMPSLLVGWGLGYWLVSLLYLLGSSWPQGAWSGAHVVVDTVGYILLPLTFLLGVFVVADSNMYGTGIGRVLKPVAKALGNNTRVLHWTMVTTVLRDVTILWMIYIFFSVPCLNVL